MENLILIIVALLSLSFLIFIHELGHYFMARREGMKVETFSIGFGKPLIQWEWDSVKWQIGWLLFGGYVRIAGTDTEKDTDLYQVKDGFFGKSPWSRIKVALMGPVVNIIFALLLFALLWVSGGREKSFFEYTHKVGWIDPKSELYAHGVRPGDEIWAFDAKPYQGIHDLLYLAVMSNGPVDVKGGKIDYSTGAASPFDFVITPYPQPTRMDKSILTTGILAPASYLIYDRLPSGKENPLPEKSPMGTSGIQYGDRIVWVDGHRIFSEQQLSNILNDGRALLTIERSGQTLLARAPRVEVQELKMDPQVRDELTDWQFAAGLQSSKFTKLWTLPYNLTNDGVVESEMRFIDKDNELAAFPEVPLSPLELPLQPGDRIISVEGIPVKHSSDILKLIQGRQMYMIVQRLHERIPRVSYRDADKAFDTSVNEADIRKIANTIGKENPLVSSGNLVLLKPIKPKHHQEIYASSEKYASLNAEMEEQKKQIASIEDPDKRARALQLIEQKEKKLELGLPIRDMRVEYNPVPTDQFANVFNDIWRTLFALLGGSLSPKWMSGPVGIVHMFQEQSKAGLGDALYWLGVISLNLGILNLLPIPMLDGGTVMFSLFEMITGRRIKPKTMEKLILPFAILLIAFFVFLTYHDLTRIFGGFWRW